ncbi:MAG: serine hydrolase [Cyanobacteria bacterium RYN_339]|nr:serine hydrolase [Cyanobacteria bacterium RYN_339]
MLEAPACADLDAVVQALGDLPGRVSFLIRRLDRDAGILAALNADEALAVGTAATLFTLGALVDEIATGRRTWADVVTLQERWKSLPPGLIQDWPGGSPLTFHSLATLMVAHGDLTAADHVLLALGREAVEQRLIMLGVAAPQRSLPILATREQFMVKFGPDLDAYLAKDTLGRRAYLAAGNITQQKLANVELDANPRAVSTLGWFASAADMIRTMTWLQGNTEGGEASRARRILGVLPGPARPDKQAWPYVGYKGGAEPGVLSLNYLLRSAKGGWFALSATWNDETAPLDEARFIELVAKAIALTR